MGEHEAPAGGVMRTVRGAAVTWFVAPDGSHRIARLGDTVTVADEDVERFDRSEGVLPGPPPTPADQPIVDEPPRRGPGSGRDVWAAYAESVGFQVPGDASREQIIAMVDDRGV